MSSFGVAIAPNMSLFDLLNEAVDLSRVHNDWEGIGFKSGN